MAVTNAVTRTIYEGGVKRVLGTITSAAGDFTGTLAYATHGLRSVFTARVVFEGIGGPEPNVTISNGTVTWTVDDTQGRAGRWDVTGR